MPEKKERSAFTPLLFLLVVLVGLFTLGVLIPVRMCNPCSGDGPEEVNFIEQPSRRSPVLRARGQMKNPKLEAWGLS